MITKELYSNEPNKIVYPVTVQGVDAAVNTFTAILRVSNEEDMLDAGTPITLVADERDVGTWEMIVDNDDINGFKYAKVYITYNLDDHGDVRDTLFFDITKRYLRYADAKQMVDFDLSWEVFDTVEKDVRYAIESYCVQKFDCWYGTRIVRTTGKHIDLPQHLESMTSVTPGRLPLPLEKTYADTVAEGYYVSEAGYSILNPKDLRPGFFIVKGQWGFTSVPGPVTQAAWSLFKSKMCDDVEYRNRYIDNIRNENIRIQFRDEAYSGDTTGNAFADDILQPYKLFVIGVV